MKPSAPTIEDVESVYFNGSTVAPYWHTSADCTSSAYEFTRDGVTVASGAATLSESLPYLKTWTCSYAASVVGNYAVAATATNADGTSAAGTASFVVADPPQVSLSPASDARIEWLPIEISWAVDDVNGVVYQELEFTGEGVSYRKELQPNVRSVRLDATDVAGIQNGEEYHIWLTVTNGVGLTTTEHHWVTVDWEPPTMPTMTGTEADPDTASVSLRAYSPTNGCDVVVWRVTGDGRVVIGEGSELVEAVDPLPPLGVDVTYEAVAIDRETGAVSETQTRVVRVQGRLVALNFGADAGEVVVLRYGQKLTRSATKGGELYHFADGGDGVPEFYPTGDTTETGSVSAVIFDEAEARRLYQLCKQYPVGWLRDPYGMVVRARMVLTEEYDTGLAHRVSIEWAATRGGA